MQKKNNEKESNTHILFRNEHIDLVFDLIKILVQVIELLFV